MVNVPVKLIECPRDAMQGWPHFINTTQKIDYINALLQVGFDTIDFGSFVSARAIPQMADTATVIQQIDCSRSKTKLLAIVANERGALEALKFPAIQYLGFPFSVSETFQHRNTNSSIQDSLETVRRIQEHCAGQGKEAVVYLSMGFGNPYGDAYSPFIVLDYALKIANLGVGIISVADTVGLASPALITEVMQLLSSKLGGVELGIHLHSSPTTRAAKLQAAADAGCYRFDGALKGIGGCPMANDELVGNMDTEAMIAFFRSRGETIDLNEDALLRANAIASSIFV